MRRQFRLDWRGVRLKGETIVAEGNALGNQAKKTCSPSASAFGFPLSTFLGFRLFLFVGAPVAAIQINGEEKDRDDGRDDHRQKPSEHFDFHGSEGG